MRHPTPTVVLILSTNEIKPIQPGSCAAQFACGEAISLDLHGREPDAEVLCDDCAKIAAAQRKRWAKARKAVK